MNEDQLVTLSRRLEAISEAIDQLPGAPQRERFIAAALAGSAWAKKENGLLIDPELAARRAVEIADATIARMERPA